MQQKLYRFIFVFLMINFIQAAFTGLSYDEAYYWMYSKYMSWGYFDHPPMIALSIWMGTVFSDNEFWVRLFPAISAVVGIYYIWETLDNKNIKYFATLILSLPLIHSAGFIAIPDTPLFMFTAMFFFALKKYLEKDKWKYSILLAVIISGMFFSKYHSMLTVILTIAAYPAVLKRKTFWGCVAMTICFYLPHMYWQMQNEFITFDYHLFGRPQKSFKIYYVVEILGAIIAASGLTLFPIVARLLKVKADDSFNRILKFNILGFWIFLFILSFRNPTEANWLLSSMIPLVLYTINNVEKLKWTSKYFTRLAIVPILLLFTMRILLLDMWEKPLIKRYFEMNGWDNHVQTILEQAEGLPIVSNHYQFAAKLSYEIKESIPAWHYKTRSSQFKLWDFNDLDEDKEFLFVTKKKLKGSSRIDLKYRGPLYTIKGNKDSIRKLINE